MQLKGYEANNEVFIQDKNGNRYYGKHMLNKIKEYIGLDVVLCIDFAKDVLMLVKNKNEEEVAHARFNEIFSDSAVFNGKMEDLCSGIFVG
jgi:hypothetical protein